MRKFLLHICAAAAMALGFQPGAFAQYNSDNGVFKNDAFTQNYNDSADTLGRDTTDTMFTFKEFFGGLTHKQPERIGVLFAGSTVFVGAGQVYNRDYWKLPVVYGGIGGGTAMGLMYRNKWKHSGEDKYKKLSGLMFAGAGLTYWATLLDEVTFYKGDSPHLPGRATLYSALLPGLGQAYNGEYWKIPIYHAFIIGSAHFMATNNKNYHRYKWIHNMATTEDSGYDGPVSAETALYYRDVFRRYRDYSIVAFAGFYLLQIIDANIFSYMRDFEVGDDITMNISPAVLAPDNAYALNFSGAGVGMRIGLTF